MPGIVEFPTVVQHAVQQCGDVFAHEPERQPCGEYRTGLLVAEQKTVPGIKAELAETTDHSGLHRWLGAAPWDVQHRNERRLAWHQHDPQTRSSARGIIPMATTLVEHAGPRSEDAGSEWEHAEKRQKIAHDYLSANAVCPASPPAALAFRRSRTREDGAATAAEWQAREGGLDAASADDRRRATVKSHPLRCGDLVAWVVERKMPGTCPGDSDVTNAPVLKHLDQPARREVGEWTGHRQVWGRGVAMQADERAAPMPTASRTRVRGGHRTHGAFTKPIGRPDVTPAGRIVILWEPWNGTRPVTMLVAKQPPGEVTRILRSDRGRWTGPDTRPRDGTPHVGLGEGQRRSGEGQTRPTYLVLRVHSLLVAQVHQCRVSAWAQATLMTIGEACRTVLRETRDKTLTWAIARATLDQWPPETIKAHLQLV